MSFSGSRTSKSRGKTNWFMVYSLYIGAPPKLWFGHFNFIRGRPYLFISKCAYEPIKRRRGHLARTSRARWPLSYKSTELCPSLVFSISVGAARVIISTKYLKPEKIKISPSIIMIFSRNDKITRGLSNTGLKPPNLIFIIFPVYLTGSSSNPGRLFLNHSFD